MNENNTENELLNIGVELEKQKKKKDILIEKLISEVISDSDFAMFDEKLEREIAGLSERERVLKERQSAYNNSDMILSEIRKALEDGIIKRVVEDKIIETISEIRIYAEGKCKVHFDEQKLFKLLSVYRNDVQERRLDGLSELEFIYNKPKKYEVRRQKTNQLVLAAFKSDPHLTIQGVAEQLNEKYSYIYTSVAMLRKEGKL